MHTPAPQSSSFAVGDITVKTLSDGHLDIPAGYFSNASESELQLVRPSARFGANCWLIETGTRKILVDAGSGDWLKARFPDTGHVTDAGTALVSASREITDIILTHMHADHIGGLISNGQSLFPNAKLHLQESEWAFWTNDDLASTVPEDQKPIVELIQSLARPMSPQVELHTGDSDLGEGIHLSFAPGHTPGHQIVQVANGGTQAFLLGDALVSGALQFANPDVRYALDSSPETAAQTRKTLFDKLAADQIPFAATHLDTTRFGVLQARADGGYSFEPIA